MLYHFTRKAVKSWKIPKYTKGYVPFVCVKTTIENYNMISHISYSPTSR